MHTLFVKLALFKTLLIFLLVFLVLEKFEKIQIQFTYGSVLKYEEVVQNV